MKKKVLFDQDNVLVNTSVITIVKIEELKFKLLPHTPCMPDIAPRIIFSFQTWKRLDGQRFANNEEVESAVNGYFEELNGSHYKQAIEAIEHRWREWIELKADYFEK